jgi:alpha,alpha-trehalase
MEDSCVLVTSLASDRGVLQITDCLTLRSGADLVEPVPAGRSELLRHVEAVGGDVHLRVRLLPKAGVTFDQLAGGWRFDRRTDGVQEIYLWSSVELEPDGRGLSTELTLRAGETLTVALHWSGRFRLRQHPDTRKLIDQTVSAWRRWASGLDCQGSQAELMKRSALTLKLLDHAETGAIMAAATSSLPEWPGAPRNWDYRYTWVRDASFSNYVFRRIGDPSDADVFLAWVLTNVERDGAPHVMYALDGSQPPDEVQDPLLRGYRGSAPVRWGNGAIHQLQHDVYGEIIDIAYQWSNSGGRVDGRLWAALTPIVELAIQRWKTPDSGPREIRADGRPFTYSAALCFVAVDRAIQIARRHGLPYPRRRWELAAREIREAALTRSWNPERQTFTEQLGGTGGLDAALLTLPVRNVIASTIRGWCRPRRPLPRAWTQGTDCCSATGRRFPRTGCPEMRAPSCSAASGSWITLPVRAGSKRPTRCTRRCAAARIRSACCRNRSIRTPASSSEISRRPSAMSVSWPAGCAC